MRLKLVIKCSQTIKGGHRKTWNVRIVNKKPYHMINDSTKKNMSRLNTSTGLYVTTCLIESFILLFALNPSRDSCPHLASHVPLSPRRNVHSGIS